MRRDSDTRRMAETGTGSGRSPGSAVPKAIAHTSLSIGEQSSHKLQNPFGSALIHRPISEAIAQADADEMALQAEYERNPL